MRGRREGGDLGAKREPRLLPPVMYRVVQRSDGCFNAYKTNLDGRKESERDCQHTFTFSHDPSGLSNAMDCIVEMNRLRCLLTDSVSTS